MAQYYSTNITPLSGHRINTPPATLQFVPDCQRLTGCPWIIVGTYRLKERRNPEDLPSYRGSLKLFCIEPATSHLIEFGAHDYPSAGIYFLRFICDLLIVGTTDGRLSIFTVTTVMGNFVLQHKRDHQVFDKATTITSFVLLPEATRVTNNVVVPARGSPILAVTSNSESDLEKGRTSLVRFRENDKQLVEFEIISTPTLIPPHNYRGSPANAVCCVFNGLRTLLTGGDEGSLRMSIFTGLPDGADLSSEISGREFKDFHLGGLLCILPWDGDILFTGGYDDRFQVSSISEIAGVAPKVLAEIDIQNGVYNLSFMDTEVELINGRYTRVLILASCCYGGVKIIEAIYNGFDDRWSLSILASMTQHNSLCYASDSIRNKDGSYVIVSSSFYDKQLCVWKFTDPGFSQKNREEGYGESETRPEGSQINENSYESDNEE